MTQLARWRRRSCIIQQTFMDWRGNSLNTARLVHTATMLADGRTLLASGIGPNATVLASAELYDYSATAWATTGSLSNPHATDPYSTFTAVASQWAGSDSGRI